MGFALGITHAMLQSILVTDLSLLPARLRFHKYDDTGCQPLLLRLLRRTLTQLAMDILDIPDSKETTQSAVVIL